MFWNKKQSEKTDDEYRFGNIIVEKTDGFDDAFDELFNNRVQEAEKKSKYILLISIIIITILSVGAYVSFSNSEKVKHETPAESNENSVPFYHLFLSTQGKEEKIAGIVRGESASSGSIKDDNFIELCAIGYLNQINEAISNGANVNARDHIGTTPLMAAASSIASDPEVIKVLISAGANIDAQDSMGMTPLALASRFSSNPEIIAILLRLGADPNVKDKDGKIAIDYAKDNSKIRNSAAIRTLQEVTR